MIAKNERLNVGRLNLKLAFSKFISNESFSLDWKQVAKSTPLLSLFQDGHPSMPFWKEFPSNSVLYDKFYNFFNFPR